jgi:predicted dehydrogenase
MARPTPSRRELLRGASMTLAGAPLLAARPTAALANPRPRFRIDNTVRLGIVGAGRRGHDIIARLGYPSDKANAPDVRIENVDLVSVCDVFAGNRHSAVAAISRVHSPPAIHRDYREMFERDDLDGVIIATPDFSHAPIATAAIEAGIDVYLEKCAANTPDQLRALERALAKHDRILQVGYQLHQDVLFSNAVEIFRRGWIGEVRMARFEVHRNGPNGQLRHPLLQYGQAPDASEVDWELFLAGIAPERDYDPERFFEWRKFWDYSNGSCGDNQSHSVDAAEFVLGLDLPTSAMASGGVYQWGGQRETPDVLTAAVEYADAGVSVLFTSIDANQHMVPGTWFYGTEGTMHVSWELKVFPDRFSERYAERLGRGELDVNEPMLHLENRAAAAALEGDASELWLAGRGATKTTRGDGTFDTTRLHLEDWLTSMRDRTQPSSPLASAKGSTLAAMMSAESYRSGRRVTLEDMGFGAEEG